jgi:hypothetical protein
MMEEIKNEPVPLADLIKERDSEERMKQFDAEEVERDSYIDHLM